MPHLPLSQSLAQILDTNAADGPVTLNKLIERTEARGLFLVIILLCLPFILPVSVPGMSTPFGLAIAFLAARLALGRPPRLPPRLGNKELPPKLRKILLGGGVKFLRFLEKGVRPRRTQWMGWRAARAGNALVIVFMALLLALPLPPLPPLTNTLPSYAIILVAASMMEEDGLMIWLGYLFSVGTVVYLAFWAELIAHHVGKWIHKLVHFFQGFA